MCLGTRLEFLGLSTVAILDWVIPCCEELSYALRDVSRIPGLYLLGASSTPPTVANQIWFQTLSTVPWGTKTDVAENNGLDGQGCCTEHLYVGGST